MKEQVISFDTAKLAKEKGFDEPCLDAYNLRGNLYSNGWCEYINDNDCELPFTSLALREKDVLAPTQSLLQKWLREKHNIGLWISIGIMYPKLVFEAEISYIENGSGKFKEITPKLPEYYDIDYSDTYSLSYEEALEIGLQEALKLIK